ncbi:hypothetical protein GCM10027570_49630 [Streptomonospora sediminis]
MADAARGRACVLLALVPGCGLGKRVSGFGWLPGAAWWRGSERCVRHLSPVSVTGCRRVR